ncbi:MAG: enoyl-CoA hydratase [Candidatus Diapherotrites archaeon]|uniref:Enoyl-CoA hydratase n=1 Tax=Candidatus Iainarchaeum sp. TaxID=3101447 RepID=A0A2D6LPW6_9ARCH|nr:enoyl-CoA hydratase [Candidatus Diapherotrites archaeon]|tara:strand:- start:12968 stop:13396 length:429 start_codon:yes stop_codon:yes gene_type:complete
MLKENKYVDLAVGQKAFISREITEKDIMDFAKISGDMNPLHVDKTYAKKATFKNIIAHGILTAALISAVLGTKLPGPGYIYLQQEIKFLKPVFPGDTISVEVEITKKINEKKSLELSFTCTNQRNQIVLGGSSIIKAPPSLY